MGRVIRSKIEKERTAEQKKNVCVEIVLERIFFQIRVLSPLVKISKHDNLKSETILCKPELIFILCYIFISCLSTFKPLLKVAVKRGSADYIIGNYKNSPGTEQLFNRFKLNFVLRSYHACAHARGRISNSVISSLSLAAAHCTCKYRSFSKESTKQLEETAVVNPPASTLDPTYLVEFCNSFILLLQKKPPTKHL